MSSLDAFNDMMAQFLNELVLTFPDDNGIQEFRTSFEAARVSTPRAPLEGFMSSSSSKLMSKDDSFFASAPGPGLPDLSGLWNSAEATPATKAAIWQYMQTLHILGTTLTMFPPETLSAIENAAKKCAESGSFDPSVLQGLMGSLMGPGGAGDNPFAALMGAAGPARPRPRSGQRQKKSKQ